MTALLTASLMMAAVNVILLAVLGSIWFRNYRSHGASHTLGLLIFAIFLFLQNSLWLYFYGLHSQFIGWFVNSSVDIQIGMFLLCGLETVALLILFKITWS